MRILVDMDNTIVDSFSVIFQLYEEETQQKPLTYSKEQMNSEAQTYCPLITTKRIGEYFTSPIFYEKLKPFPLAIETLKALSEMGHEIVVVSLQQHPQTVKRNWIQQHLPFVDEIHLIDFDDHRQIDKSSVWGDVIIDDSVGGLLSSPAPYKICFNHYKGYNDHWDGIRIQEWSPKVVDLLLNNE